VTGVLTTRIYCRPSCAARQPYREHVQFFGDGEAARAHGLRACKRCLPDDVARDVRAVSDALDLLHGKQSLSVEDLAQAVGYAPHHFLRLFRRDVGVTPTEYRRGRRMRLVEDALARSASVTDAMYEAGYTTASRFYADAGRRLGMTPAQWRSGAAGLNIEWTTMASPLGDVLFASTERSICRIACAETSDDLRRRFANAVFTDHASGVRAKAACAMSTVSSRIPRTDLPVDVQRLAYELMLWRTLSQPNNHPQ
jgi:AraC family transcriptional regulator, regulatory protein of adaptative response / methylated-DNA-[protein]-cysteine methyltransferase